MSNRLEKILAYCKTERVTRVGLKKIEEEFGLWKDIGLDKLATAFQNHISCSNAENSVLIYCLGLSDNFDFTKGGKLSGGSPPDI